MGICRKLPEGGKAEGTGPNSEDKYRKQVQSFKGEKLLLFIIRGGNSKMGRSDAGCGGERKTLYAAKGEQQGLTFRLKAMLVVKQGNLRTGSR